MTDRISLLIRAKNLSAAQFADEIGVQRSSISHLMSGRNKPSLDLIQKTLQRFPEVSTEWLLFGKGEMVRELNLFDSQARSGATPSHEKFSFDDEPMMPNREAEPSLFTAGIQHGEAYPGDSAGKDTPAAANPAQERMAVPAPYMAENAKPAEERKESVEDAERVTRKISAKKEGAINQIIVLYDDRTFMAYSPGN